VGDIAAGDDVRDIADALYAAWYTRPTTPGPEAPDPPVHRSLLVGSLRAAHAGAGIDASPLTVVSASPTGAVLIAGHPPAGAAGEVPGAALVERRRPGEYVAERGIGVPVHPGERVLAVVRRDHLDSDRGLWWCFSPDPPRAPLGRLYLHARPATAARVVNVMTEVLGDTGTRYQLKCPSHAAAVERVDALVVYHDRAVRGDLVAALTTRGDRLRGLLNPDVPPLTCQVLPGVAWADEDGPGHDRPTEPEVDDDAPPHARHSYGESRCLALAAALHATGATWGGLGRGEQVGVLLDGLAAAGIDPTAPWKERAR
jgi:hypothetical protein